MYQLNVYVHILSAIIWVGGMFFVSLVVVPATRHLPASERGALLSMLGSRFRTVGWVCIVLLVITGIFNAGFRGVTWGNFLTLAATSSFGHLLAAKIGLVAVMIVVSVIHDFVLGPRSTRLLQQTKGAPTAEVLRLRKQASWLARVNAMLALAVVALAVMLVRGVPG